MLDELVPGELSDGTRRALVERAEGNPFFLEELLAAFVETGAVEELPDSVQAILSARVDRLESGDKAALQAASVIGRVFWSGPTLELVGGGARRVDGARGSRFHPAPADDVDRRRDGVRLQARADTRGGLRQRSPRHGAQSSTRLIAAWLERTGSGRDEERLCSPITTRRPPIPRTPISPGRTSRRSSSDCARSAVRWLRRAAELAIRRYDLDEGLAGLQRALELCEPQERLGLWREIGRASALKFDGERFWEAMKSALKLTSDPTVQAEILADLACRTWIRSGMWPRRPDSAEVEGWIRQALELAEPDSTAYARALVARAYWNPGEEHAAAGEGSTLAEQPGDVALRSFAWGARASAAFAERDYEQSFDWALRRSTCCPRSQIPTTRRRSTRN